MEKTDAVFLPASAALQVESGEDPQPEPNVADFGNADPGFADAKLGANLPDGDDDDGDDLPVMPQTGDEVLVSLRARAVDGLTMHKERPMEYEVGSNDLGPISTVCETLVKGMKVGDETNVDYGEPSPDGATLALTLEKIFHTLDLSPAKDRSIVKKRLKASKSATKPRDAAKVTLLVEHATDGSKGLPGFEPQVLQFTLGSGEVCDALEFGAAEMVKGERSILKVTAPHMAVEARLGLIEITAERVVLTVELADFEDVVDPCLLSTDQAVEVASSRKETGTDLFKAGRFQLALRRYRVAAEVLDAFEEELDQKSLDLRIACKLNLAACLLQIQDYISVRTVCNSVLQSDPESIKGLYRRARAEHSLQNFVQCIHDCRSVIRLDANNNGARALLKKARDDHQTLKGLFYSDRD